MSTIQQRKNDAIPLCVDLDGTLVNTDCLVESALKLFKENPITIFSMLIWLCSGKANLKEQIARRVSVDVHGLPLNVPLLEWLRTQHGEGRELVLVTAANFRIADAVAAHLNIFSHVIASSATCNLVATNKRDELVQRFGRGGYDYAGNSRADLAVWADSRNAVVVNASGPVAKAAAAGGRVEASFPRAHNAMRALLYGMRPYQWSKNLLVFVSIMVAHHYTNTPLLLATVYGFIAFCLCSSAVYLINDLLDLSVDRMHEEKKQRPFASGRAPIMYGVIAAPLLLLGAFFIAASVGAQFTSVLSLYFVLTLAYSLYLKRIVMLDVLVLALLYTLRLIAGAAVAQAMPSVWLVSFSLFIFSSLALAKRYTELKALTAASGTLAGGRGYHVSDISIIAQLGVASGYLSVLVLALYLDSQELGDLYAHQQIMWLLCPLMMYWVGRIWLLASRGELTQDPVVYATKDRVSYVVLLFGLLIVMAAL